MKKIFLILLVFITIISRAQIAIGTLVTDPSAIVDLTTNSKGLLIPRMTISQRNTIETPAVGLLIYNTDDSDYNSYNGGVLGWQDFSTGYKTVNASGDISTILATDVVATGMTLTPELGTYSVLFNSQFKNTPTYSTTPGVASTVTSILSDLSLLIADLDKYFVLDTPEYNSIGHTHYASYDADNAGVGSPISNDNLAAFWAKLKINLYPGAYYEGAAINFVGTGEITLDGLGDPNAKFIFKANAAINSGIGVKFKLINGAQSCNIFWLATGGMSIGATNEALGNWVSRAGAVACGIATNLDGRMLTSAGALTMGDGILNVPTGSPFLNMRSLVSFVGFTGAGDVNITGAPATTSTIITGDIFTCEAFNNFGFTPPYGTGTASTQPIVGPPVTLTGKLYHCSGPNIEGTGVTITTENNVGSIGTFSIYKNGIEIPEATKTVKTDSTASIITLQTIASFSGTDVVDIRWKTASGNTLMMGNRNLTLIKVQ